jgi:hypothetical protein
MLPPREMVARKHAIITFENIENFPIERLTFASKSQDNFEKRSESFDLEWSIRAIVTMSDMRSSYRHRRMEGKGR